MLILVSCSDPGIAQIVKIFKTIFDMIQVIGPVLAMLSLAWIFLRNVMAGEKEVFKNNFKKIKNALIALVVTFFLPVFVNLVMSATFMSNTFEVSACWKDADSYKITNKTTYIDRSGKNKSGSFIINPDDYNNSGSVSEDSSSDSKGNALSKAFVNLAEAQLNDPSSSGGKKYWSYLGYKSHVKWCSEFVTWNVFHTEANGVKLSSYLNKKCKSAGCWANYCKNHSNTKYHNVNGYSPKEGDLVFFSYRGNGVSHIGIVRSSDNSKVYTIEGNVNDKVRKRAISLNNNHLYGYCSWY